MKIVAALTGKLDRAPCAMKAASWASARKTYDGPAETGKVATSAPITGPERSVMIDAVTTNAAATIMRRTRMRMKWSSGDIFVLSSRRRPGPITTGFAVLDGRSHQYRKTISIGVMDPGFRQDDTDCWTAVRASHPLHRDRDLRPVL